MRAKHRVDIETNIYDLQGRVKIQKKYIYTLLIFFLILFFLISGCQKPKKEINPSVYSVSAEEKKWMNKFFRDVFLTENGIYTLWGSKPITRINVEYYTQEEIDESISKLSEEDRKGLIFYEYDLGDNWIKWKEISSRFPIKNYLFFEKPHPTEPKITMVFIVNILNTALILQHHYGFFQEVAGFDFDPISKVFELQDKESPFWTNVWENYALVGILFGYGFDNSFGYNWKHSGFNLEKNKNFVKNLKFVFSDISPFQDFSLRNFPIPQFASFHVGLKDEVIEKYKKEREEIKKIYKGEDFVELTLKKLTS